jgi:hypothetical protein
MTKSKLTRLLIFTLAVISYFPAESFAGEFSASVKVETGTSSDESSANDSSSSGDDDGYLSEETHQYENSNKPFWLGLGVWVGGGANILFKPSNPEDLGSDNVAPFGDGAGGMGGGGGAYLEMRWLKGHLGLLFGIWNERNRTWTTMAVDGTDGNKFINYYSVARLPLLVEGIILKNQHRIKFGLGPEFAIGLNGTDINIESSILSGLTNNKVFKQKDVLIAFDIGWGVKFGDWVFGLDLKTAYNLTQPKAYSDRVKERAAGFSVIGSHSLDFRLMLSLMWEIGFPR